MGRVRAILHRQITTSQKVRPIQILQGIIVYIRFRERKESRRSLKRRGLRKCLSISSDRYQLVHVLANVRIGVGKQIFRII